MLIIHALHTSQVVTHNERSCFADQEKAYFHVQSVRALIMQLKNKRALPV